jgi:hypothetical protein
MHDAQVSAIYSPRRDKNSSHFGGDSAVVAPDIQMPWSATLRSRPGQLSEKRT